MNKNDELVQYWINIRENATRENYELDQLLEKISQLKMTSWLNIESIREKNATNKNRELTQYWVNIKENTTRKNYELGQLLEKMPQLRVTSWLNIESIREKNATNKNGELIQYWINIRENAARKNYELDQLLEKIF